MSAVPGSPDVPDSPRECFPLFQRQSAEHVWKFVATAFPLGPGHLLTARHAVDGRYSQVEDDGGLRFEGVETGFEWAVAVPGKDGEVREVMVRPTERPDDPRLDAVVLEVVQEEDRIFEGVCWLAGLDDGELQRTGLDTVKGQMVGYRASDPVLNSGWPKTWPKSSRVRITALAADHTQPGTGLERFRLPGGGLDSGMSGGPAFLDSAYGRFCVGMAWLGGLRAGPATVLGADALLTWLRPQIGVRSLESVHLPPEFAADYLKGIRQQVRTLLVPLLGRRDKVQGAKLREIDLRNEAAFIRLFVCLHAGRGPLDGEARSGEAARPRPEAERELYELVRQSYSSFVQLPEYAVVAAANGTGTGLGILRAVRSAIDHCLGEDRRKEPDGGTLEDWMQVELKAYSRHLNRELDAGNLRLAIRDPVWQALQTGRDAVLVGRAGSGKSTVAQFLALALALPKHRALEPKLKDVFDQAAGLRGRIPVFLRFRDLNGVLGGLRPQGSLQSKQDAIEGCVRKGLKKIAALVPAERMFVIWDGLDELVEPARSGFAAALADWNQRLGRGAQCLVTSRPTAYPPGDPRVKSESDGWWEVPEFDLWHLKPLDPVQQRELLEGFLAIGGNGSAREAARDLFELIRARKLEDLARDPLMLAALARLSEERRRLQPQPPLPRLRADVFSEIIDLMLYRWEGDRADQEEGPLRQALRRARMEEKPLRALLGRLAWIALGAAETGDFTRRSLIVELGRLGLEKEAVLEVVEALSAHSGLLRPLESGSLNRRMEWFEFPVRSYRNFLAAEALLALPELPPSAPVGLGVAHQVGPARFLAELLDHGLAVVLPEVVGGKPEPEHANQVLAFAAAQAVGNHHVGEHLDAIAEVAGRVMDSGRPGMPLLSAAIQLAVDVGQWTASEGPGPVRWMRERGGDVRLLRELAGRISGSDRDSRFDRAAAASLVSMLEPPPSKEVVQMEWCRVGDPGSLRFLRGDSLELGGGKATPCDLVHDPFHMARFPVTVELFDEVAQAAGLDRAAFNHQHTHWPISHFSIASHPVVGVDWSTATRWCEALTLWMRGGRIEGLPDEVLRHPEKWEVRLPEEWEWELAARGPLHAEPEIPGGSADLVRVPWGWATKAGIRDRVNCDSQFGGTTPVAHELNQTKSPWGVESLVGNAFEWCRTPIVRNEDWSYPEDYETRVRELANDPGVHRVVRGGSWNYLPVLCRCADRNANPPVNRGNNLGFRPVLAPVPSGAGGGGAGRG